jgi:hypothetical protein
MAWEKDSIWATSTVLDGAVKVDRQGNTVDGWWPREDPVVAKHLQLPPLLLDKNKDNRLAYLGTSYKQAGHTHLNALAFLDGKPIFLLNKYGCLVQLEPTRILVQDPRLVGGHNILVTPDRTILVNDTVNQAVLAYSEDGNLLRRLPLGRYGVVRRIRRRFALRSMRLWLGKRSPSFRVSQWLVKNIVASRPVFVRGLCSTPSGSILVGISPATVLEIDYRNGELVDVFAYSKDVNECIHGLNVLPGR